MGFSESSESSLFQIIQILIKEKGKCLDLPTFHFVRVETFLPDRGREGAPVVGGRDKMLHLPREEF